MQARWLAWLACLGAAAADPSFEFRKDWDLGFGRADRAADYSAAVCPDGTLFFSNGRGTAVAIRRNGKSVSNWGRREFRDSRLAGCDARGWLYVQASRGGVTVLEGDRVVAEWYPAVKIQRVAAANEAPIYAAGVARNRLPLHAIGPDGRILYSFGERQSRFVIPIDSRLGFPLWDGRRGRLLYVPEQEYEIRSYQPDGKLIEVRAPHPNAWIQPVDLGRVERSGLYYPGTLEGASADGALYFTITDPEVRVARVRLRRR